MFSNFNFKYSFTDTESDVPEVDKYYSQYNEAIPVFQYICSNIDVNLK